MHDDDDDDDDDDADDDKDDYDGNDGRGEPEALPARRAPRRAGGPTGAFSDETLGAQAQPETNDRQALLEPEDKDP